MSRLAISHLRRSNVSWRDFQTRQKVIELGPRFVSFVDEGTGPPVVLIHGIPNMGLLVGSRDCRAVGHAARPRTGPDRLRLL